MYKEAQKTIFDQIGNPKNKQPFRFMHCWLYLNDYPQWFYRDPARGVQNTHNKCKAVGIDLTMDEGQAGQGSGGSPTGELQRPEGQKKCKNNKAQPRSIYGCIEKCSRGIQTYE